MGPKAGMDGRKISSPTGIFLITTLLILQDTNTMYGRYLSNVLLTDCCPCVRIALFVCYPRPGVVTIALSDPQGVSEAFQGVYDR